MSPADRLFWQVLWRMAWRRPSLAAEAWWWHITGRKVRARKRLHIGEALRPDAYDVWIRRREAAQLPPARWTGEGIALTVIVRGGAGRTLASLGAQAPGGWDLIVIDGPAVPDAHAIAADLAGAITVVGDLAEAIAIAQGRFVLPVPEGAELAPGAIARWLEAIAAASEALVLYADHDLRDARGRRGGFWFKPGWNPEALLAQDYISPACAIATAAARGVSIPDGAPVYALLLAVTGLDPRAAVVHVPHVLAHLAAEADDLPARLAVVRALGFAARPGAFDTVRVDWPRPDPAPLVSVMIPTRDRVGLLRTAVGGVLEATDYPAIEVVIIDNGSTAPDALAYMAEITRDPRVRVLRVDAPFNFALLNNRAAAVARGEFLLLLNNDIEVIAPDWLSALVAQAVRPGIGAVGAKLLYDDGAIQHAGVVVGMGDAAGHAHRFQRDEAPGYHAQAHIAREATAVTAACLLVRAADYRAVGGLDEDGFAVAFNDVDFCLKLRALGRRNIYEPASVLIHHESKSRGRDVAPEHIDRYRRELALLQARWGTRAFADAQHHPQLARMSETYVPGLAPGE